MAAQRPEGRLVGVDFGARRTGVALADPLRMFARPHGTWTPHEALDELARISSEEGVEVVVLGWPLTEEGGEGSATEAVRGYEKQIRRRLPGVRVVRWDERFTSVEARELLAAAGVSRKRRGEKPRIDAAAAAVILQSYLDANRS